MTTPQAHLVDAALALPHARVATRRGRIAVASWDEDALTLAAAASLAVTDRNGDRPQAVIAATVTGPLIEPGIAPFLVAVLGLHAAGGHRTYVAEHGGSVAAGGSALAHALSLVATGVSPVLVVAADTRRDARGRPIGDGAAAMLVGAAGDGGLVTHVGSDADLFLDRWRREGEGVTVGDRSLDRFGPDRSVGDRFGETAVAGPSGPHVERVGHAGTAQLALLMLTRGTETGRFAASAGGVTHAFALDPGSGFSGIATESRAVVAGGADLDEAPAPVAEDFQPFVSHAINRREIASTYRLEAVRDEATGQVIYPAPPGPAAAGTVPHRLARTGTVHTFARDHVFPVGGPVTMAVVDLDGGGRFYAQVADGAGVSIGQRVHLALRRVHSGDGVPHYFWKVIAEDEETG